MRTCQRVVTDRGKVEYCHREASHTSPKGVYTGRVIDVCPIHKKELTNLHQSHKKEAVFKLLVDIQKVKTRSTK